MSKKFDKKIVLASAVASLVAAGLAYSPVVRAEEGAAAPAAEEGKKSCNAKKSCNGKKGCAAEKAEGKKKCHAKKKCNAKKKCHAKTDEAKPAEGDAPKAE